MKREQKPSQVVGVFDTETANDRATKRSLPVCYQMGECWKPIPELQPQDVETAIYRHVEEAYAHFDRILARGIEENVTPVIAVHNLAYDVHFIMDYLDSAVKAGYTIECCFKSSIKPLAIKVVAAATDDKGKEYTEPVLIFWDTLSFSGKGLARMGQECGYLKAVGEWDYDKIRTPETPLTAEEEHYAREDVIVPFIWLQYWAALNADIPLDRFGKEILTKTSVVRYKTRQIGQSTKYKDGKGKSRKQYDSYALTCKQEAPKTAEDYALMIRSTSAGWTFTASEAAGATYKHVQKYDATSMHPSHMVSHYYPRNFTREHISPKNAWRIVRDVFNTPMSAILKEWYRPFKVAFNARIKFTNLRPKAGSVFARDGVMLHGSALFKDYKPTLANLDDESTANEFNKINAEGYANTVVNARYEFGKLVSADECVISLNELNAWVHAQVYEWDRFEVLDISAACRFLSVPDHVINSVATMLERKKTVKDAMHGTIPTVCPEWLPESVYNEFVEDESEVVEAFYKQVKADLNSLYGMFATNEYKESVIYTADGNFKYDGISGYDKEVKKPKAWYNFGLRIAAWSRVQQCIAMQLINNADLAETFINGDTDSFAWEGKGCSDAKVMAALSPLHAAINTGIDICTRRSGCKRELFTGLGEYMVDCEPAEYCAVANKRYAYKDTNNKIHVASAGVPNKSVARAIEWELKHKRSFSAAVVCGVGYNAGYACNMSGAKYKCAPGFNERLERARTLTDYLGHKYTYPAGSQVGIFLGDTVKILGAGYDDDHIKCLRNGGIIDEYEPPHFYEDLAGKDLHKY